MTPQYVDPFSHGYENEHANDLIVTMKFAVGKQRHHLAFQGEVSEWVTRADQMDVLIAKLEAARDDALLGHDPVKAAVLEGLMEECRKALRFNARQVTTVSQHHNDPTLLYDAGYDFKPQPAAKGKVNLVDLLPELEAKLGPVEGSIILIFKNRPTPKAIIEAQISCTPDDEQSWRSHGEGTYNSSRAELRGLEPVKKTYIRARYHENGAVGRWSAPISIIVH
jgi:hypothetical protein